MTGIPASIGAQLLAHGNVRQTGVLAPEVAFEPTAFIAELARRGIRVEERIEDCGIVDERPADALAVAYGAEATPIGADGQDARP